MSVEGPIEPPLRLSELADVDSPEVVKAALSRFRRRVLVRTAWLAIAVVVALLLYPTFNREHNDLRVQFLRSPGESTGTIIRQAPYNATILNVVRLNKAQFGVHLVVANLSLKAGLQQLVYAASIRRNGTPAAGFSVETLDGRTTEIWFVARTGSPKVVIPFFVVSSDILHKPTIDLPALQFDLRKLNIASEIWR